MAHSYVVFISAVILPPYIVSTLHRSALLSFFPSCILLNRTPRFAEDVFEVLNSIRSSPLTTFLKEGIKAP